MQPVVVSLRTSELRTERFVFSEGITLLLRGFGVEGRERLFGVLLVIHGLTGLSGAGVRYQR